MFKKVTRHSNLLKKLAPLTGVVTSAFLALPALAQTATPGMGTMNNGGTPNGSYSDPTPGTLNNGNGTGTLNNGYGYGTGTTTPGVGTTGNGVINNTDGTLVAPTNPTINPVTPSLTPANPIPTPATPSLTPTNPIPAPTAPAFPAQ